MSNFDDIVKAAEESYTYVYSTQGTHAGFIRNSVQEGTELPSVSSDEVKMALTAMTRGNAEEME